MIQYISRKKIIYIYISNNLIDKQANMNDQYTSENILNIICYQRNEN